MSASEPIDPVDQQLIQLLEEKPAEELSFEQLDLLRSRLEVSPPLRAALANYLQTESYLTQVLGSFSVSPEAIISRAEAENASRTRPWQWLAGSVLCLGLIGVLVAVFANALKTPEPPTIAQQPGDEAPSPVSPSPPADDDSQQAALMPPDAVIEVPADNADVPEGDQQPPVVANNKPQRTYSLAIPAEHFAKGNVKVDNSRYGNPANVVITSGGERSSFVEYTINLPASGKYYLHLRYASNEPRPMGLDVNHRKQGTVAKQASGGNDVAQQKWFAHGKFDFKKGKNLLRFTSQDPFPHLNRIVVSSLPVINDENAPGVESVEVAQAPPWEAPLAQPNPPSYVTTAFDDFDTSKSLPQVPDLMRWFQTLPGLQRSIGETHTKVGKCGELDGVFRLLWPWQEHVALRLSLENHDRLRMHFYTGNSGLTLVYYQDQGYTWAAYQTTRKDDTTHEPQTLALTTTDEGRCQRTEMRFGGPIDLRWHAGELILSRGNVVLLRAPLAQLPQDVFFDGRVAFHGIAVVPSKDSPPPEPPPAESTVVLPASLDWHEQLTKGGQLQKHDDGSVELMGNDAEGSGWATAPIGNLVPSEIVLEIDVATRGSGVYLAAPKSRSFISLRFANNTRHNPPAMCAALRWDELRETDLGFWHEKVVPLAPAEGKRFVRLVSGAGIVRTAISIDGVHWSEWDEAPPNQPGAADLCLHYVSKEPNCRIKISKIHVRPLAALARQADPDLLQKVPMLTNKQAPTIAQWLAEVSSAQPANVPASVWRRTCAVRALAAGCDHELGSRLVNLVLDDAEARRIAVPELLALYQEAFSLLETRHNAQQAQQCWSRYTTLAQRAAQEGLPAFSTIRSARMSSTVSWRQNLKVADEAAIRLELLRNVYAGEWQRVADFCRELRFYQQHEKQPLVDWAEAIAARQLPGRPAGDASLSRLRSTWRPLLVEELSKDAYNQLAELQAILDSDAFEDAARLITSISPDAIAGVAPHGRDRSLLVSLPSAIRLAVRRYPGLERVMNDKFGPLAQLRVRQSISNNNVAAVELAAVQFESTEAAAEAHRWLGDRALAAGQFARAAAEYQRALRTATSGMKHELLARQRLAAAMQGQDSGEAVTRAVSFGETTIAAAEFEAIVADMKAANASGQRSVVIEGARTYPALKPSGYEIAPRSRLDGAVGQDPNAEVTRDINGLKINWAERQIATLVEGNTLYVTNRFQLAAYNLDHGQRLWQATMPGSAARSRDWTLIPMRPLLAGNVIYVRMLYNAGPMLGAFEKSSGKLLWTSEQRQGEYIVSDPLLIQNQLVALTLTRNDQGQSALKLTTFDRDSGEPIVQRPLARLNEVWWSRRIAEVAPIDDGLVASLGGLTLSCDVLGSVRWMRRPVALPPEEESSWIRQYVERPLVIGDRVFVTQPGVRTLECVDADTGRLIWSQALPDIESILGAVDQRLVVRTSDALLALDPSDGKQLWRHERPQLFDALLLGGEGGLMYVERAAMNVNQDRFAPRCVWLDPATGEPKQSLWLASQQEAEPHLGPLVTQNNRLWGFWGKNHNDPSRDFVEFVPKADAPPALFADAHDPWTLQTEIALRQPAERMFADWALLAGGVNGDSGAKDEVHGESKVLGICVRGNQPALFAKEIAPPAGSHPKLRVRFNHQTDQDWNVKLSVQFGGETVWTQDFSKNQSPRQWKDLEVDLTKVAGRQGTLVVRADLTQGGEMSTWWKRLEYVP